MNISEQELPKEWVELVKDAMKSNISKEKFKMFLIEEKKMKNKQLTGNVERENPESYN